MDATPLSSKLNQRSPLLQEDIILRKIRENSYI